MSNLGIEDLESVLFVLKEPRWANKHGGDSRFWHARGIVQKFLDKLYEYSFLPMTLKYKDRTKSGKRLGKKEYEFKCFFLRNSGALRKFKQNFLTMGDFFKNLESTYISELIYEVKIRVKIKNSNNSLTFRDLSEGEQQLLTVLGLLRFTQDGESLFLLDEPDTHLNPNWSKDYIKFLNDFIEDPEHCQIILGTHSPLVISGLTRDQVLIMSRDENSLEVRAFVPNEDPRGMGFAGILKSDMFGFKTTLDDYTTEKLSQRAELLAKKYLLPEEQQELIKLSSELSLLGFSSEFRDPIFEKFMKAYIRRPESKMPEFTPEERAKQDALADEILHDILTEDSKS